MTSTLRTLLDRVEKGEGADFELDCRLAWTFGMEPWAGRPEDHVGLCMPRSKIAHATPALTSSVDAVLALVAKVLPDYDHEVYRDREAKLVTVDIAMHVGQHAEEPRATLLALLRAKIAQEGEQ